jgi:hypothetical protein
METSDGSVRMPVIPKVAKRSGWVRNLLAIDERETFIGGAQSIPGRLLIYVVAVIAIATYFPLWEAVLTVSASMAAAYLPTFRTRILFTTTWVTVFLEMGLAENYILEDIDLVLTQERVVSIPAIALASGFLLLIMSGAWTLLGWVRRDPRSFLARRPLIMLLFLEFFLCGLTALPAMKGLPRVMLWSMVIVLTPYVWFLPFAVIDLRSQPPGDPLLQMAALRPFWSPTYLPFGKGAALLRKTLSKNPRDLAITQIKAIKLLAWANALILTKRYLGRICDEYLHIPSMEDAMDAFLHDQPFSVALGWSSIILEVAKYSLKIAMWAGLFIGIARLAGYRLPRGSWRPLESRTLMDYFNRFHYYFKELLVDLFFLPSFFTLFRNRPRLRMFFATFMAAGVGNAIWHFMYDIRVVASLGLAGAIETYTSYGFYCVVLATGIGISQVRANMGIRPPSSPLGRVYSFLFVWSFVTCLHVFGDESRNHSLTERFRFLGSLFGVP